MFLLIFMLAFSTGLYLAGAEVLLILFVLEMPENVSLLVFFFFFPMNLIHISRDSKAHC